MKLKRTHHCAGISKSEGQTAVLSGWVDRWRDHGGVVFIDLRDRSGIAQVVFDPRTMSVDVAGTLRQEAVISVSGTVRRRPVGMENTNLPSGTVELAAAELEVLSRAQPLPFPLHDDSPESGQVDESLRLTYRYLELRRPELQRNLRIRHEFVNCARQFYTEQGFWDIETPILYKSTPEGARDYLVPSRVHPGQFYALPQSPQTLKQLCMIGGIERYFQVARCFRDEDLRLDRQPEFTQIDVEMSFIDELEIQTIHEQLMVRIFDRVMGQKLTAPFPRLAYKDAIERYGSDKPDLRNPLTLVDLADQGKRSSFQVYKTLLESGAVLKGLCFEEKEPMSRSELDSLPGKVASFGAKGVTWIRIKGPGDWQSPQAKFFDEGLKAEIEGKLPYKSGAMLLLVCGKQKIVDNSLSFLRDEYGERFKYTDKSKRAFVWVTDFPLFEYDDEGGRLYAAHHPFTSPHLEDLDLFMKGDTAALRDVRARAYDLVLDGFEIGGGSLRIYDSQVQERMFHVLGMSAEEATHRFGFFIRALQYGTPPHGGIALGVDRIAMLLTGASAIRDVIAFPKTQKASDLMSEAPSDVSEEQLTDLALRILRKNP